MAADYEIPILPHTIEGRSSMRSIADALEALCKAERISESQLAQIRTAPIRLPKGEITSIVLVISPPREGEPGYGVALARDESG